MRIGREGTLHARQEKLINTWKLCVCIILKVTIVLFIRNVRKRRKHYHSAQYSCGGTGKWKMLYAGQEKLNSWKPRVCTYYPKGHCCLLTRTWGNAGNTTTFADTSVEVLARGKCFMQVKKGSAILLEPSYTYYPKGHHYRLIGNVRQRWKHCHKPQTVAKELWKRNTALRYL